MSSRVPSTDLGVLISELCAETFAIKNRLLPRNVRAIWDSVGKFTFKHIVAQKGVQLPGVGTFAVGPLLQDKYAAFKRWRPVFNLTEGKFGTVPQERTKYRLAGKAPVVQLNYSLIAQDAGVHRGLAQQVVSDLCYRLSMHLLSGHSIQVELPQVGLLQTAASRRVEFVFQPAVLDQLDIPHRVPLVPSSRPATAGTGVAAAAAAAGMAAAASRAQSPGLGALNAEVELLTLRSESPPPASGRTSPLDPPPQSDTAALEADAAAIANHCRAWLRHLAKLCKQADRMCVGAVPRLQLEGWLYRDCKHLLHHLDAATLFELLQDNTKGRDGRLVDYQQFLQDFALAASAVMMQQEHLQHQHEEQPRPKPAAEPAAEATQQAEQEHEEEQEEEVWQHAQQEELEQEQLMEQGQGLDYYHQQEASATRAECDEFNRMHFGRQLESRGGQRVVTPKVQQDPLNSGQRPASSAGRKPGTAQSGRQGNAAACGPAGQQVYVVGSKAELLALEEDPSDVKLYPVMLDQGRNMGRRGKGLSGGYSYLF